MLIVVIVGYALYNQFFYESPKKEPTINHPIIVDSQEEKPDEPPFEGIIVEWMPIVDETDRVKLYMNEDELFNSPFILYEWQKMELPVYKKIDLSFEEIDEKTEDLFNKLQLDITNQQCEDYNQDGLKVSMCNFDQGYLEVVQDGSFYIIFHDDTMIPIQSFEVDDIKKAIQSSWIANVVNLETFEVFIENKSYDTFGEMVYDVVLLDKKDGFDYQEKYKIMFSYETKRISGISKNADKGKPIKSYDVLLPHQIEENIQEGLYYSLMVEPSLLKEITIKGYGLTYDTSMFTNVIIPIVNVYTTSDHPTYTSCFDASGIVVHPLKVIGIDPTNIRAN